MVRVGSVVQVAHLGVMHTAYNRRGRDMIRSSLNKTRDEMDTPLLLALTPVPLDHGPVPVSNTGGGTGVVVSQEKTKKKEKEKIK